MTTLVPEPKTTHPTSSPLPAPIADLEPAARIPAGPDAEDVTVPTQPTPAGPPALLVEHVTKRFNVDRGKPPVLAIDDVSLRLERGAIQGVLGANGSGKSTLIRLVSGLLTLDEGKVEVFGYDIERDELAVKRLINRVLGRRGVLQEAQPDGEPPLRRPPVRPRWQAGEARGDGDPRPAGHREEPPRPPGGADEPGDAAEGRDRASPADEPDAAPAGRADHRPRPAQQARRPGVHRRGQRRARRDDRPHDARPGRGGAPLRADHDPRRGPRPSPRTRPRGSSDSSPSSTGSRRRSSPCS